MKTITAIALSALIATQALAVDTVDTPPPPPPPAPEVSDSGGSTDIGGVVGTVLVIGLILWATNRETRNDMHSPRPLVRPQDCLDKHGAMVSC